MFLYLYYLGFFANIFKLLLATSVFSGSLFFFEKFLFCNSKG